ncbi:hypothetical protein BU24DRAFT_434917 [Aaosphaeria arxii CBS 175.79]|uniref:TPR domain protein n=1 Tax=Aaosphaeria arxii CBS 175.79 TaxID=1450172 RepID=A0A6A5XGU3_9PLEO|nr:uncharacterized protein BU24DRAFT_434917 [Aaosphaeria arxii CBS 175.79]KAF2012408.1 hypothetical protein BU24DRAFT_434917 [Aaosphaeria arxii CBS 175.79]
MPLPSFTNEWSNAQYYNLGAYHRVATSTSQDAQMWFDRGLVWCYSFNHEAALDCFWRAIDLDRKFLMPYWGVAYAAGPNYNKSWGMFTPDDRERTVAKALRVLDLPEEAILNASPLERALVAAVATRFPSSENMIPKDMGSFNEAYAKAMRSVYQDYSDDPDVATLFADAVMCVRPRALWDLDTGVPTAPDVVEARVAMEKALTLPSGRNHPGLCHLYIHMMEMSPFPEAALTAADRLRRIVPDGSHMQHMATHIDVACGDYRRSVDSNYDAIFSDDKYFANVKVESLLYTVYRSHNIHALAYAAMMSGRCEDGLYAARRLPQILTEEFMSIRTPRMVDWTEWQLVTLPHVLIRFGRWQEVLELALPDNQELLCVTTATIKYARGIALAVLGRVEEARVARDAFEEARNIVPEDRKYGPNASASSILAVASAMLEGELEYRAGNHTEAFTALRHGIELEDKLPYADPPLWMQPIRHALAALLLEQGRSEEAEALYMEDLGFSASHSRRKARLNNVWGLHGLYECLVKNKKHDQAHTIRIQRDIAVATSDVAIGASCFCRLSAAKDDGKFYSNKA